MKSITLFVLVFLGISVTSYSQENNTSKPERVELYPYTPSSNTITPEQEIANCEAQIEALDTKEAKIRESEEQIKIAEENGWFEQAEKNRQELQARIKELKSKK
ncbi:MAG: hypothetical protein HUJ25_15555 [Crocinitomicaceae bacterium]|nr:hypothetical protein [Crocinitomicaceae bacterium]